MATSFDWFFSTLSEISCFDNDGDGAGDGGNDAGDGAGDGGNDKTFNQSDVDKIVQERLARDRKAREETQRDEYKTLETSYQELLENQNLTVDERDKLSTKLEDVQKQLRTKDQQSEHDMQQVRSEYETKLAAEKQARESWELRFRDSSISRSIQDAAAKHEAYDADQLEAILRPMAKLDPVTDTAGNETGAFQTLIDFPDQDEKGDRKDFQGTPDAIVKRLKELPKYQNLFKANVASGLNANSATGGQTPGSNGRIDASKLTMEQYVKIRKENPELLGLRKK